MKRFVVSDLPLQGLTRVERMQLGDHRGFLSRLFCADEIAMAGWHKCVAQINHTYTAKAGTVRGMHFQEPPHAEMKLVSCIRGEVWDVAVDLRAGSRTFLDWHAEHLSAGNSRAMLIPEGFAHGFQTLTDDVELLYVHSTAYAAEAEKGLCPCDPVLAIMWPMPIGEMSLRDQGHPLLGENFVGMNI